ncbi:MAG: OmpH family outer membrane protein [Epsilonproteobacteria bacterium]|nr:MAG: OmpH family outer membrane protein [Campylobacterota bacterium]
MKKRISLFLVLLFVANISYAELKIGFVNVAKVLEKAPQAEKAKKRLEKEFSPRDKHLVTQGKGIKKLEEKLARDASVMGESERRKLEKDIIAKKRDAKRAQQEFSEDFNMRRNEELGKLQRRILEAIRALAKDEKFDLLMTDGVIYASEKIDVTGQVQKKLASLSD